MEFSEKIQILRKEKGYSQETLAEKVGVSRQAVSKWESGLSYPETDKLIILSELFGCSIDELLLRNTKLPEKEERQDKEKKEIIQNKNEKNSNLTTTIDSSNVKKEEETVFEEKNQEEDFDFSNKNEAHVQTKILPISKLLKHIEIRTLPIKNITLKGTDKKDSIYIRLTNTNQQTIPEDILFLTEFSNNRQLEIKIKKRGLFGYSRLGSYFQNLALEIYLPNSYHEDIEIDTIAGEVNISNILLGDLEINSTDSCLNFSNLSAHKIEINGVSKKIDIKSYTGGLEINSVSSDIHVDYVAFEHSLEVNSVSSTVRVSLPIDSSYYVSQAGISSSAEYYLDGALTNRIKTGGTHKIEINGVNTHLILNEYTKKA